MAAEDADVLVNDDSSSRSSDSRSSRYQFFTRGPSRWSSFARQRAVNWTPFTRPQQPLPSQQFVPQVSNTRLERSTTSMPSAQRRCSETSSALSTIVSDTEIPVVGDCRSPAPLQTRKDARQRHPRRASNWSHRASIPVTWVVQTALCCLFSSMVCAFTSVVAVWALNRYFTTRDAAPELLDSCTCQESKVDKSVLTDEMIEPLSTELQKTETRVMRSLPVTKIPSTETAPSSPPLHKTTDIAVQATGITPRRPSPIDYLIVALQILAALPVVAVGAVIIYFIVMGLFMDIVQLMQRIFGARPPGLPEMPPNLTDVIM